MGTELSTGFDYGLIADKDAKGKLISLAARVAKLKLSFGQSITDIGKELLTAQAVLANHNQGIFTSWVRDECGFSIRTAYRFISVATRFGDGCANLAQLEDSALYVLAESETPKSAVKEALRLADQGVRVTHKVAKDIVARHRPPETPECEVSGARHEWESDGDGQRFCSHCKEDHPENSKPITDALDCAVPEGLREIFARRDEWKEAMQAISTAKKLITSLTSSQAIVWLDIDETERLLGQARANLRFAMPYTECPKCRRKKPPKDCLCKGTGWITESLLRTTSDEDKEWLKARS